MVFAFLSTLTVASGKLTEIPPSALIDADTSRASSSLKVGIGSYVPGPAAKVNGTEVTNSTILNSKAVMLFPSLIFLSLCINCNSFPKINI